MEKPPYFECLFSNDLPDDVVRTCTRRGYVLDADMTSGCERHSVIALMGGAIFDQRVTVRHGALTVVAWLIRGSTVTADEIAAAYDARMKG